ncbi:MAG TPA: hypothetical protein VGO11_20875 [Chthoniobacteraceae bacterium]|jgi:hypothetical protein|nr:hypothetical protein [Chthoniobacteraceae bacterium]
MKSLALPWMVIAMIACAFTGMAAEERPPAPVSATFIDKKGGKPPMKFIRGSLILNNKTQAPLWFVLPYRIDEPPKLGGPIKMSEGFEPTWIVAEGFNTGVYHKPADKSKGKAIQLKVLFLADDKPFCLFRLPPGGRVEFKSYPFEMWSTYARSFKVWTADEIKVNGAEPLEKWLPYETLSDPQTVVPESAQADNLNFDAKVMGTRTDFRKEPITQLELKITGSWDVAFKDW